MHTFQSDGVIVDSERELETALLRELQLDAFPDECMSLDDLLPQMTAFDSAVSRRVLLLELSGIATVDRNVHPDERALLERGAARSIW